MGVQTVEEDEDTYCWLGCGDVFAVLGRGEEIRTMDSKRAPLLRLILQLPNWSDRRCRRPRLSAALCLSRRAWPRPEVRLAASLHRRFEPISWRFQDSPVHHYSKAVSSVNIRVTVERHWLILLSRLG